MWTSRDHREGNEVKGRRGSRAWRKGEREGGRAQSVYCRLGCAEQDGGRETQKLGEMLHKTKYRYKGWCLCQTETSRNLTKRAFFK